jgi:hypothetical protein
MTRTLTVLYRGSTTGAVAFREMLAEQGVEVAYDPPLRNRSDISDPEAVRIYYHCSGPEDVIRAVLAEFKASSFAATASLEVQPDGDVDGDPGLTSNGKGQQG